VGFWEVKDGPLQGATLDIRANGTATASVYKSKEGKTLISKSTIRVEDNRLYLTTEDKTGRETVVQTILELTQNELVIRDEDKQVYKMRRVK
jgi:hypothetical protein